MSPGSEARSFLRSSIRRSHSKKLKLVAGDYRKLGYTPIWILHDKQFNKRKIRAAEELLRQTGGYYTNIDEKGHGEIYDQFDITLASRRLFRGPPLKIDLTRPLNLTPIFDHSEAPPQMLLKRIPAWPIYFGGDLLDSFLRAPSASMRNLEERFFETHSLVFSMVLLKNTYQIFFRMVLEKVCR